MIRFRDGALGGFLSGGSRPERMAKVIKVRVSDELHQILKEWAGIEGISMAALVRREFEGNPLEEDQILLRSKMKMRTYTGDMAEGARLIREGRGDWW
jgi:hypothetical protein